MSTKVLAVDDESDNLALLENYLEDIDADVVTAKDGIEAWKIIRSTKDIEVILLDRMMPNMDGIQLMEKINSMPKEDQIPVIMQTAAGAIEQIEEGVQAGVFYYLVKPYSAGTLNTLVKSATREHQQGTRLRKKLSTFDHVQELVQNCELKFQTMRDARNVSIYLAACYPDPQQIVVGISELLINAVEHGNLAISFDEKTDILEYGGIDAWSEEIDKRLNLNEYKDKWVNVSLEKNDAEIIITIKDEGVGFQWEDYLNLQPGTENSTHGRGIPMCKHLFFDELEYLGNGNEVRATTKL